MRTNRTLLTVFSAFCCLAQAGVVHLDVSDHGDISVDIHAEAGHMPSDSRYSGGDDSTHEQVETQRATFDQYDVSLPYEVHRGFLSVS